MTWDEVAMDIMQDLPAEARSEALCGIIADMEKLTQGNTLALIQTKIESRRYRRAFYGTLLVCAVMTVAAWLGWASYFAE